jgi:hypothetical protein
MKDCFEVEEYRIVEDHYEIHIGFVWRIVPERAILRQSNPTGHAVACIHGSEFRCFIPNAQG